MKIPSIKFFPAAPVFIFIISCFIWFLILAQSISFFAGLIILGVVSFLVFWRGLLIIRNRGELLGLKSRKKIFFVSLTAALIFYEMIWIIYMLPFPFFILGGIFAIIFTIVFNVFREYFRRQKELFEFYSEANFKKVFIKNIAVGVFLIIILISISPWLPPKTF